MSTLDHLRQEIDRLDDQIIALLTQRMDISKQVAIHKRQNNLPILQSGREQQILDKVAASAPAYADSIQAIYREILAQSRSLQE